MIYGILANNQHIKVSVSMTSSIPELTVPPQSPPNYSFVPHDGKAAEDRLTLDEIDGVAAIQADDDAITDSGYQVREGEGWLMLFKNFDETCSVYVLGNNEFDSVHVRLTTASHGQTEMWMTPEQSRLLIEGLTGALDKLAAD